jgi:hypothetical protein
MDATIYPDPNPAVTAALISAATRAFQEERIHTAEMLYRALVAKRTGRLAAATHTHVGIGGVDHDRIVSELVVGGQGSMGTVDYAASYNFGADVVGFDADGHRKRYKDANPPHNDLNKVLQMLEDY